MDSPRNRMFAAQMEFVKWLVDELNAKIVKTSNFQSVSFVTQTLPRFLGIPGDVLLYGHRDGDWYHRQPLMECPENTFHILQRFYYGQGLYLIEESDHFISRKFVFKLYSTKPQNNHKYFNLEKATWHHNNMLDEYQLCNEIKNNKEYEHRDPNEMVKDIFKALGFAI